MADKHDSNPPGQQEGEKKEKPYRIQIDKREYEIAEPMPTGRELLTLAGKLPVEQFGIYLRVGGQQPKRISLEERVNLRDEGVERFVTLPLDQTEG